MNFPIYLLIKDLSEECDSICGFDPPLIPHQLRNKNPLEFKGIYPFGSDGLRTLTSYALLPKKSSYSELVKQLLMTS